MKTDNAVPNQNKNGFKFFTVLLVFLLQLLHTSIVRGDDSSNKIELTIDAGNRSTIIDTVVSKLQKLYVYPDIAQEMIAHIQDKLGNHAYDSITSLDEFVQQLTNDLLFIYPDGHLEINVLRDREGEIRTEESMEDWWERRTGEARYNNFYFRKIEWLPGNIGYLDFRKFEYPEMSGPTAVAVMQFLAFTDAIIIDLRQNPGGRGELSQLLISYFFDDHRVHYSTGFDRNKSIAKQWWTIPHVQGVRKPNVPVYILTSRGTGSAAEELAYSLKHLNRAVIVGDTTAGAAHKTHRHIFSELKIEINMPDGRSFHPNTGKDWEGVGVIPHIVVAPDKAFDVAYYQALDTLSKSETDEIKIFRLDWAKKEMDAKINPINLSSKAIKEYVGIYGPRKIIVKNVELYYQRENRPEYQLIPLGNDWFMLDGLDYFRIAFGRDSSGKVMELIGVYDDGSRDVSSLSKK